MGKGLIHQDFTIIINIYALNFHIPNYISRSEVRNRLKDNKRSRHINEKTIKGADTYTHTHI